MEKNRYTVYVAGKKFTLVTDDTEKQVMDIASRVDTSINSLVAQTNMSKENCAILSALDFCDDEFKARLEINEIKEQIKEYFEDSARLRSENEALRKEIDSLKEEIKNLSEIKTEKEIAVTQKSNDISSDDDLSFDEAPVKSYQPKPQKQEKKRHEHNHTNVYRQQFLKQNEQEKGYTPKRQYSLFDDE